MQDSSPHIQAQAIITDMFLMRNRIFSDRSQPF